MILLRYIHSYTAYLLVGCLLVIVTLFGLIPYHIMMLLRLRKSARRWLNGHVKFISKGILISTGSRVAVFGQENLPAVDESAPGKSASDKSASGNTESDRPESNGVKSSEPPRIGVYSNHQSLLDIPLIAGYLPYLPAFVAKQELLKVPVISSFMKAMQCVTLKRGDGRSSIKMLMDGVKVMKRGVPLVVFPEGTRSGSNNVGTFKGGSLKLAAKAKAQIVPVTIVNTHKIFKSGKYIVPASIQLFIHKPIDVSEMSREQLAELPDQIRDIVAGEHAYGDTGT